MLVITRFFVAITVIATTSCGAIGLRNLPHEYAENMRVVDVDFAEGSLVSDFEFESATVKQRVFSALKRHLQPVLNRGDRSHPVMVSIEIDEFRITSSTRLHLDPAASLIDLGGFVTFYDAHSGEELDYTYGYTTDSLFELRISLAKATGLSLEEKIEIAAKAFAADIENEIRVGMNAR